jgi:protocatechuate 3,4-dioxygenase beta subunit
MRWLYVAAAAVLALLGTIAYLATAPADVDGPQAAGPVGPASPPSPADAIGRNPGELTRPGPGTGPANPDHQAEPAERVALADTEAQPAEPDEEGYVVTGRVVGPSGLPLPGAQVYGATDQGWIGPPLDSRVYSQGTQFTARLSTQTAADGHFELTGMQPGGTRLAVRAPGFAAHDDDALRLPEGGSPHDLGDIVMAPGLILAGHVVDTANFGVASAEIVRVDESADFFFGAVGSTRGALLATTGADGSFRIDTLRPGPWKLMVLTAAHPDEVFEGVSEEREVGGLVFELEPGVAVGGRVVGAPEQELEGLLVRASPPGQQRIESFSGPLPWRETTCDAAGRFSVGGLEAGEAYELRVRATGGHPWDMRWLSTPQAVQAGARDVTVRLQQSASVSFRLEDAETGAALDDYEVDILTTRDGETDSESFDTSDEALAPDPETGRTTLDDLRLPAAGARTSFLFQKDGYHRRATAPIELTEGGQHDLGTVELTRMPTFLVRVVDAETDEPVEGVAVSLEIKGADKESFSVANDGTIRLGVEDEHRRETDERGLARLPRFDGKRCELTAYKAGYATADPLVATMIPALSEGDEPAVEIRLGRGGVVRVLVVDATGTPSPSSAVRVERLDVEEDGRGFERSESTDDSGSTRFEHLAPGTYRVEVERIESDSMFRFGETDGEQDGAHSTEVRVVEGGDEQVMLVRPPRGALLGRVTEGGKPLPGAGLRLEESGGQHLSIPGLTDQPDAHTDASGRYRIDPVNGGSHELVIEHASRVMDTRVTVVIEEGDNVADIELPTSVVEGRVTDAAGAPVAGAEVEVRKAGDTDSRRSSITFSMGGQDSVIFGLESGDEERVLTDADGRYRLRGVLAETELVVTANHETFRGATTEPFEVAPGALKQRVDLVLEPAGRLAVTVTRQGAPLGNVTVRASFVVPDGEDDPGIDSVSSFTDGQGRAALDGLAAGTWSVQVEPPGWSEEDWPEAQLAEVSVGETRPVDLALP